MNRLEEVMGNKELEKSGQRGQKIHLEFSSLGNSVVIEAEINEPFISAVRRASQALNIRDKNVFLFVRGRNVPLSHSDTVFQFLEKHRSTAFGLGRHGSVGRM